ncbi:hypothetical protein Ddc_17850 [Ditylenchus destructor]|nr:hypothetical protein Ddc_17850 [Ditylenchus destructor]
MRKSGELPGASDRRPLESRRSLEIGSSKNNKKQTNKAASSAKIVNRFAFALFRFTFAAPPTSLPKKDVSMGAAAVFRYPKELLPRTSG